MKMLKGNTFQNYCLCGGAHHAINGRDPKDPHMFWCPQKEEYDRWVKTGILDNGTKTERLLNDEK